MAQLDAVPWPPEAIVTARLRLRATTASDRAGYIELFASPVVRRYLGGAIDHAKLEAAVPPVPGARPGVFAVEADGAFVGTVSVDRRDPDLPGHVRPGGLELELGYTFLPSSWGHGYATEACAAVLAWIGAHLPGEPVVLVTQTANDASVRLADRLGFREVDRFVQFEAEQWFGVR